MSILRLKKFNYFDEVLLIDITKQLNINISKKSIVLLPRIDTELTDNQIKQLFKTLHRKGVNYILLSPTKDEVRKQKPLSSQPLVMVSILIYSIYSYLFLSILYILIYFYLF